MSALSLEVSAQEQRALERFYFYEARLLDSRQFQQWLALVSPDIRYVIPARVAVQINNRERGSEAMLSVEQELEGATGEGCPLREEGMLHLALRVERAYKINSWSEQPPARTRRMVGNIELMAREGETLNVLSNFHLYYARPGTADTIYSGQRRDQLQPAADESDPGSFRIVRREVVLDYANIDKPTLGLFF